MDIKLFRFEEMSTRQLYDVLKLRSEIFVVEQECIYLDPDGKDQPAYHLLGYEGDMLAAYTRIFAPGDYMDRASIGRVAVAEACRGRGYGREIMKASLEAVVDILECNEVAISAQAYLRQFYADFGFEISGDEYLEDGIPHIKMLWRAESG